MRWARPLTIYNLMEVVRIINICGLHMILRRPCTKTRRFLPSLKRGAHRRHLPQL